MGFKKASQNIPKSENDFIDSAHGETNTKRKYGTKRSKKLVINFTEDEFGRLNQKANANG